VVSNDGKRKRIEYFVQAKEEGLVMEGTKEKRGTK